jgi:hypothetical protein
MSRPWHLLLGPLALLAGCVTVDATLRSDGSARIVLLYLTPPDASEFLERARFTSAGVTVESVKIFEDQTTVARLAVEDVRRLRHAKGLEIVDVARERVGRDEEIRLTLDNPKPTEATPQDARPWLTLSLTLPGPVVSANRGAAVLGSRLTWIVRKSDYQRTRATVLTVRYRPPPS